MSIKTTTPSRQVTAPSGRWPRGFTLIELMVAVAVLAILSMIALTSYRQYIIRSNRVAAQAVMMDIANRQQQYLLGNRAYADKTTLEGTGFALPSEVSRNYSYAINVNNGAPPSFTITFTAIDSQASDGNLTLNSAGVKTPADKWK